MSQWIDSWSGLKTPEKRITTSRWYHQISYSAQKHKHKFTWFNVRQATAAKSWKPKPLSIWHHCLKMIIQTAELINESTYCYCTTMLLLDIFSNEQIPMLVLFICSLYDMRIDELWWRRLQKFFSTCKLRHHRHSATERYPKSSN